MKRNGLVTEYRAAIPWSRLGLACAPGSMEFAFVIQDNNDGSKARYRIEFGGGIAEGNSLRMVMEVFSGPSLQTALVRRACQHPVGS
ncbi:MAG: hypothetical protein IJC66_01230 [Kiritimatiellae bacterium]|nr:hypothetical protein [Kiritimatiellia bacterium]